MKIGLVGLVENFFMLNLFVFIINGMSFNEETMHVHNEMSGAA